MPVGIVLINGGVLRTWAHPAQVDDVLAQVEIVAGFLDSYAPTPASPWADATPAGR
ncbi:hypothetical protein OOJ91_02660 [Micromonospora lupini]|uniref:hypothetical protein n=1 Tax=Micromonospora lupini TaxID=285679 RepID=UPI002250E0ED|nr:hypothetical protein [Micromonospora lupini]MCX5064772.1 hypothetical protein [Micromonospora lupini]